MLEVFYNSQFCVVIKIWTKQGLSSKDTLAYICNYNIMNDEQFVVKKHCGIGRSTYIHVTPRKSDVADAGEHRLKLMLLYSLWVGVGDQPLQLQLVLEA